MLQISKESRPPWHHWYVSLWHRETEKPPQPGFQLSTRGLALRVIIGSIWYKGTHLVLLRETAGAKHRADIFGRAPQAAHCEHMVLTWLMDRSWYALTESRWYALTDSSWHALTDSRWHAQTDSRWHALTDSRWHALTDSSWHALTDSSWYALMDSSWYALNSRSVPRHYQPCNIHDKTCARPKLRLFKPWKHTGYFIYHLL